MRHTDSKFKPALLSLCMIIVLAANACAGDGAPSPLVGIPWTNRQVEMTFLTGDKIVVTNRGVNTTVASIGKSFAGTYMPMDDTRVLVTLDGPLAPLLGGEILVYDAKKSSLALKGVEYLFVSEASADAYLKANNKGTRSTAMAAAARACLRSMFANFQQYVRDGAMHDENANGVGEYVSLEQLAGINPVTSGKINLIIGDLAQTHTAHGCRFTVCLPPTVSERERYYAVIAIPEHPEAEQVAYAITQDGVVRYRPVAGGPRPSLDDLHGPGGWTDLPRWPIFREPPKEIWPGIPDPFTK